MTKAEINKILVYRCPQHNCGECGKTTADAGGLLFRCRSCPQSYCDDCLPDSGWSKFSNATIRTPAHPYFSLRAVPIGDTIPDFEVLGHGKVPQAYFISCGDCEALFATDADALALWEAEQKQVAEELQKQRQGTEQEPEAQSTVV